MAVNQLYVVTTEQPHVTTLSFKARTGDEIAALTRSVLSTPAARALTAQDPGSVLFIQIASGSSQLKHLLIDLGMHEGAVSAIQSGDQSAFAVVSRVEARNPATPDVPDPLAFGTDIEPLFYVKIVNEPGVAVVNELPAGQFHPGFSRIRF